MRMVLKGEPVNILSILQQIHLVKSDLSLNSCTDPCFFYLAVGAHHNPSLAFLTIILDRACLGSKLKNSRHSGDGQKACLQGSRNAPFLPSKQAHALSPLGANFHPPFFLLWWVWFDPKTYLTTKELVKSGPKPAFLHPYTTFLAGKWHKSSPPLSSLTPNSLIFMQKCYVYV